MYGLSNTSDPFRFVKLSGHAQIMRVCDPVVPLETVLSKPLPPAPWEAGLRLHWLSIDGKQPNIPENVPMLRPRRRPKRRKMDILAPEPDSKANAIADSNEKGDGGAETFQQAPGGVLVKAPLKHILSKELNIYMNKVTSVLEGTVPHAGDRSKLLDATLTSLKLDAGLQPLAPYLCHSFAQKIWLQCGIVELSNQKPAERYDPSKLNAYLRAVECIASNRSLDLSWYLHELIPAVVDAVLDVPYINTDKHLKKEDRLRDLNRKYRWDQRELAGKAIATICVWYPEVAPRIQKQYIQGLKSPPESRLPAIYGSVVGLAYQGSRAVQTLLFPNIVPLVRNLVAHAKACNTRELDILRDSLLSASSRYLTKLPIEKLPMTMLPKAWNIPHPEPREQATCTNHKKGKSSSVTKPSDVFDTDEDFDPCLIFSQSPQSIEASRAWLKENCTKTTMHNVTGRNPEENRYHPMILYKTADEKIEVKNQTSMQKYVPQTEIFPLQKGSNDIKIMQKAYVEDPHPAEYLRLLHNLFDVQSDPFIVRSTLADDVFI